MAEPENLFVPYESSIIAKEKGYEERGFGYYWNRYDYGEKIKEQFQDCEYGQERSCASIHRHIILCKAPTFQQMVNWFREKHNIDICIRPTEVYSASSIRYRWRWSILHLINDTVMNDESALGYLTHDNALAGAIKQALSLI